MASPKNGIAPDLEQACAFLKLLDQEAGAFTFQTFDDTPAKSRSLAKVWHGSLEDLAGPLTTLQQNGAGVFVTINETTLSGRRTAASIIAVRACFIDLDGAPLEPVMAGEFPPHFTVESSPGKYHAYWRVRGLPLEQFKTLQKTIATRFDSASIR